MLNRILQRTEIHAIARIGRDLHSFQAQHLHCLQAAVERGRFDRNGIAGTREHLK